jgi:hypothetical protein
VAVTIAVYDPAGVFALVVIVKVVDADPPAGTVTFVGFTEVVGPFGVMDEVRDVVPENPPRLESVIVEVAELLVATVRLDGLALSDSPLNLMLDTYVDQQFPLQQSPAAMLWYSPATQTVLGSDGSTAAPK